MEPLYLGDFDSRADVMRQFAEYSYDEDGCYEYDGWERRKVILNFPEDAQIIIAAYTYENYEVYAFVLYEQD